MTYRFAHPLPAVLLLLAALGTALPGLAAADSPPQTRAETLSDAVDVEITTWPADGRHLLLWLAPGHGLRAGHVQTAEALARRGMEVWQADLADALFLSRGSGGMRRIEGKYVADLIERAHAVTGKRIVLVSDSYGAIPVLRGARAWQTRTPEQAYLAGALLFSPSAYAGIPPLGTEPEYLPIVRATNLPILIFQGGANGNRWQLPRLIGALGESGATVYAQMMPGITGLFYEEDDARKSNAVRAELARLPARLAAMLPLLERTPTPLRAGALPEASAGEGGRGLDIALRPYRADPDPQALRLPDVEGEFHRLEPDDYRGQVTVVNFWASWCPPCVEEIPSLNRLKAAMRDAPFELVSVNYAEAPAAIRDFMREVQVDFPVLVDEDGSEAAKWNVIAFPSTFVIGPDAQIRYGVNAAIEWDTPQVIEAMRELLAEAS